MSEKNVLNYVDHTQLKAFAEWKDIKKLCEEAIEYQTASVCIPPCYVKRVKEAYQDRLKIATVIGFPLGYSVTEAKVEELRCALRDGADEFDMVINITDVKNKDFKAVEKEIIELKEAAGEHILKVIIETCYLNEEEKRELCHVVTNAKADFIKTSTGFGTAGATIEDIRLFQSEIGENVKIKAAGGVRSLEDMEQFIQEGCSRIGTSSAVELMKGKDTEGY